MLTGQPPVGGESARQERKEETSMQSPVGAIGLECLMNRANSLDYYELLGDAGWMNDELDKYATVTAREIQEESQKIFRNENCNTIHYLSNN